MGAIFIRDYQKGQDDDLKAIAKLFHETVRAIESNDYGEEELCAWSSEEKDENYWRERLKDQHCFMAYEENSKSLLGLIAVNDDAYIDLFYVSKEYARKGIGSRLLLYAEDFIYSFENLPLRLHVHASSLSRKLFERNGYILKETLYVEKNSTLLLTFFMEKMLK